MFDAVARRYDVTNTVLSLGQDRLWRQATRRALAPNPGERILDLAAGTAVSSAPLAKAGAEVVAADFSLGMSGRGGPPPATSIWSAADGLAPAVRRRRLRRGHHLLRAAQRRRSGALPGRAAKGRTHRRPARRLRVLPPGVGAVSHGLRRVPDAGPACGRPGGIEQSRRLRLPRRIHQGVAGSGWPRRAPRTRPAGATSAGAI